jgi:uncharacterized protein
MKPSEAVNRSRDEIRRLVHRAGMANPRLFGSVVHGADAEGSDLDLLVDPSAETSLLDLARLQVEIESVLGVEVDLKTPKFLPEAFRDRVLAESIPV